MSPNSTSSASPPTAASSPSRSTACRTAPASPMPTASTSTPPTDKFLPGTPIRVRLEDEARRSRSPAPRRAPARREDRQARCELAANPGFSAGFNPVTEFGADPYRMVVNPRPVFPPIDAPLEFRLEEISDRRPDRTAARAWATSIGLPPAQDRRRRRRRDRNSCTRTSRSRSAAAAPPATSHRRHPDLLIRQRPTRPSPC